VFLHGIGLGLAPYLGFLSRMAAAADASPEGGRRTLVAVQYRHVSMRLSRRIPTAVEVARDVEAFLVQAGISEACVAAHSYGTLVASALIKRIAASAAAGARTVSLAGLTLLDPVAFCMFLPHTLRAAIFFHRNNPSGNAHQGGSSDPQDVSVVGGSVSGQEQQVCAASYMPQSPLVVRAAMRRLPRIRPRLLIRSMFKGLIVRDPHCAAALTRGGHWSEVNLWPSELPHNTSVVIGAADHLVPVEAVVTQLQSAPCAAAKNVMIQVNEGRGHGAFVLDPAMQAGILALPSVGFSSSRAAVAATQVLQQPPMPDTPYLSPQCPGISDGSSTPVVCVNSRWAVFSFLLASRDCAFISWKREEGASAPLQRPARSFHSRIWPAQLPVRPPRLPRVSSSGGSQGRAHTRKGSLSCGPSTSSIDPLPQGPSCPLATTAESARQQHKASTATGRLGLPWVARVHSSVVTSISSRFSWPGKKI
jgi:pimeloyl-ACP methyl ester carboxylesterase